MDWIGLDWLGIGIGIGIGLGLELGNLGIGETFSAAYQWDRQVYAFLYLVRCSLLPVSLGDVRGDWGFGFLEKVGGGLVEGGVGELGLDIKMLRGVVGRVMVGVSAGEVVL